MKKKIIVGVVAVIVVIGVIFGGMTLLKNNERAKNEEALESMSKTYYEDFLYDMITAGQNQNEKKEFFGNYKEEGLKTSISAIEKVSEIDVKKQLKIVKGSCDNKKNSIQIIPQEPYGKKNYKIKVSCE